MNKETKIIFNEFEEFDDLSIDIFKEWLEGEDLVKLAEELATSSLPNDVESSTDWLLLNGYLRNGYRNVSVYRLIADIKIPLKKWRKR